jgi:hypothetical protein
MESKLHCSASPFHTEGDPIRYIRARVKGLAFDVIKSRSKESASDRYESAKEMLKDLE